MDTATASTPARIPGKKTSLLAPLTTFRFFAALAIVFYHALQNQDYFFLATGVSFFYILSGFILTYVHPRIDGTINFVRFWIARLSRIWPLHLFTLAIVLDVQPFGHVPFKHLYSELFLNFFLLQCWVPVQRIAQSFNFVSWSLSIEAFFYLAFPFLLPFVFKAPARMLLGSVALYVLLAGGAFLIGLPDTAAPNAVSYQAFLLCPILHLYEFVLGMAIAVWWKQSDQAPKAFARWSCFEAVVFGGALCLVPTLKNVSLLIVHGQTRYFLDRQLDGFLYASLFALLIYVFAFQAGALSRIFSQAWLVYLGDISFSTYMIHCIILAFFERNSSLAPLLKWPLFGLAVLCASGLLYAFLEKPSRKILVRFSDAFFKGARRPAPSLAS